MQPPPQQTAGNLEDQARSRRREEQVRMEEEVVDIEFVLGRNINLEGGDLKSSIFRGTLNSDSIAARRDSEKGGRDLLQAEARFLKQCDHPNVVKFKGFMEIPSVSYLIMELALGGNLHSHLGQRKFSSSQKLSFVQEICRGLEHIHSKNIVHRNIGTKNILLMDPPRLVIANFSQAHESGINVPNLGIVPEAEYTFKSDIFLLAIVAFQIFEDRKWSGETKAFADEIQKEGCRVGGFNKEIFKKAIWERTIMDALFWKARDRPSATGFLDAFNN